MLASHHSSKAPFERSSDILFFFFFTHTNAHVHTLVSPDSKASIHKDILHAHTSTQFHILFSPQSQGPYPFGYLSRTHANAHVHTLLSSQPKATIRLDIIISYTQVHTHFLSQPKATIHLDTSFHTRQPRLLYNNVKLLIVPNVALFGEADVEGLPRN